MKKILIVFCALFLTGCGNKLVCTKQTDDELYKTEQEISVEFDKNDKVKNSVIDYIMLFETSEEAQTYLNILESLEDNYEISLDNNKVKMISRESYNNYKGNKTQLKKELENSGYACK